MEERKKYFKGLTRRDYIAKANEIIHREGIEAVTIRRIAKEMGCSTASLYRYFDSRDELLYYAELGEMNDYIRRLNAAEKHWRNVWDIYVGGGIATLWRHSGNRKHIICYFLPTITRS